ncbi:glycoside hydrolase family 88 protein [Paenibacillus amylolyticus]|uniref:glycoside hydrolase family 88 protein n=1 Tax=Paenibacillus amylolyticus TaxID=1451 RepID=UPI0032429C08
MHLAKGLGRGYLEKGFEDATLRGYQGIEEYLKEEDAHGIHLKQICHGAGLSKERNGSYDYYISEEVVEDVPMGLAPFLLASLEVERYVNRREL